MSVTTCLLGCGVIAVIYISPIPKGEVSHSSGPTQDLGGKELENITTSSSTSTTVELPTTISTTSTTVEETIPITTKSSVTVLKQPSPPANLSILQECIAWWESNNGITDSNVYQFTQGTWETYGGVGDPGNASRSKQDIIFWLAWNDDGPSHWAAQKGRCF